MSEHSRKDQGDQEQREGTLPSGYYLISGNSGSDDGITLLGLWQVLWSQRLLIISIGAAFAAASIAAALLLTPIYRSEAVLAPVNMEESSALVDQFGGLASLAGVRLRGNDRSSTTIATLRSRAFAEKFIRDRDLMKEFFDDQWDAVEGNWVAAAIEDQPTMYDAVKYFREEIFFVNQDVSTGLVTLAVEWEDPEVATEWVNDLIVRINQEERERVLRETTQSLGYLREQLQAASIVQLQEAISRLIESEMKTQMLARIRDEYALKVIDPGMVPTERIRPRRTLIVITSTFLGGAIAVFIALLRHSIRQQIATSRRTA